MEWNGMGWGFDKGKGTKHVNQTVVTCKRLVPTTTPTPSRIFASSIFSSFLPILPFPKTMKSDAISDNIHVSSHPIVAAKISQLRDRATTPKQVRELIHDLGQLIGYEATANLNIQQGKTVSLCRWSARLSRYLGVKAGGQRKTVN